MHFILVDAAEIHSLAHLCLLRFQATCPTSRLAENEFVVQSLETHIWRVRYYLTTPGRNVCLPRTSPTRGA